MGTAEESAFRLIRFREPIHVAFRRSGEVDLRAFELAPAQLVASEVKPCILSLLSDTAQVFARILDACEAQGVGLSRESSQVRASYLPFERAVDESVALRPGSLATLEEITFIAQLELRQRDARLRRAQPEHGATLLIGESDSALRRVRKALSAVDRTLATATGTPELLHFQSETEVSLAVRRAYARFRARLRIDEPPTIDNVRSRLRGVGTQLAILVGWDIYSELRVRDRLMLRGLQRRILEWLRLDSSDAAVEGMRLWHDVAAFAEILSLVSSRAEVREHDARVVRSLLELVRAGAALSDERVLRLLEALHGLDPELDRLSASGPAAEPHRLSEAVEQLAQRFQRELAYPTEGFVPR